MTYGYDVHGLRTSEQRGTSVSRQVIFGYNADFQLDSIREPGLAAERVSYDGLGNVRKIRSPAGRLALQLDSHTNNTSLALAFELIPSGRVLLFPGDAQVGNWMSWSGRRWQVQEGTTARNVTTEDLLVRTVLYKVGHCIRLNCRHKILPM